MSFSFLVCLYKKSSLQNRESLSQRERVARASGPGEGYRTY